MAKKKNNTNNKKKNAEKKKKNTMAPSTSNPTVSADSSSSSAPPPIEGGGAKKKQESPAVAVSTSSERKSLQESNLQLWLSSYSPLSTGVKPGLMFATKLDSEDSDPELNRTEVIVYSDEMKRALSLTEELKNIPYIRVFARDSRDRVYELWLSRNDDVEQETEFILQHEWGKLVAANGLKKGYSVAGYGYDNFTGGQFRVLLLFQKDSQPPENQEPEADAAAAIFLFEKQMDGDDLEQPAIECCSDKLKMALQQTPLRSYIRVFVTDPQRNRYEMSFARHDGEGSCFTLRHGWEDIVAENGVEEGDLVTGTGKISGHSITMRLHLFKNVAQGTKSNQIGAALLFFEKNLEPADTDALLGRLLVRSCKDMVKDAVDEKLEAEGNDDGYVRVFTNDAEWRTYDLRLSRCTPVQEGEGAVYVIDHGWGDVVTDNGLRSGDKVWCWGSFVENGSIQMKIDVDKASEL